MLPECLYENGDPMNPMSGIFLDHPAPPSFTRKGLELPKEGKFPFRETNFGVAVKKAKEAAASAFGARPYGET